MNNDFLKKILVGAPILIVGGLVVFFIIHQAWLLFGPPRLIVKNPPNNFITSENKIVISGLGPVNAYLKINGQEIYLGQTGVFEEEFQLRNGVNEIRIEAINRQGRKKTVTRIVKNYPSPDISGAPLPQEGEF